MSAEGVVRFVVTGQFMTEHGRDLWVEGKPDAAIDFLMKSLVGISKPQCLEILEGRAKLTGDSSSGVDLIPDNTKMPTLESLIRVLRHERDEAEEENKDFVQMLSGDTATVGSPTGARIVPQRRVGRNGSLKEDVEFSDLPRENGKKVKTLRVWKDRSDQEPLPSIKDLVRALAAAPVADLPDEASEEEQRRKTLPVPTDTITHHTGFLSPDGKFYRCEWMGHSTLAWGLGISPYDEAWVRCCRSEENELYFFGDPALLTDTQLKLVRQRCEEKKIPKKDWPYYIGELYLSKRHESKARPRRP